MLTLHSWQTVLHLFVCVYQQKAKHFITFNELVLVVHSFGLLFWFLALSAAGIFFANSAQQHGYCFCLISLSLAILLYFQNPQLCYRWFIRNARFRFLFATQNSPRFALSRHTQQDENMCSALALFIVRIYIRLSNMRTLWLRRRPDENFIYLLCVLTASFTVNVVRCNVYGFWFIEKQTRRQCDYIEW